MKYFAYGSNMSLPRLWARVPGARRLGVFALPGHRLRFHKIGRDGSGKCDALFTRNPDDRVLGAVFELPDGGKKALDVVEGLGRGYQDKRVSVVDRWGRRLDAVTYIATRTDPRLRSYPWYLHHVVYGAQEIGLPAYYRDALAGTETTEDPDTGRDARERAIYREPGPRGPGSPR